MYSTCEKGGVVVNRKLKGAIVTEFGSQWLFSIFVKMHEADVSRVVRGRRELDGASKAKWAEALRVPVTQIFPEGNGDAARV